jgi:glycosyltransferase involved in cell wall biosynthesis
MIKLSAVVITYNEERNIERCLNSVKGIADELLVVDSDSQDNTISLAKANGATVIVQPFLGYGAQTMQLPTTWF